MTLVRRSLLMTTLAGAALNACSPSERRAQTDSRTLTGTTGLPEPQTLFAPGGGGTGPAFTGSKVLERLVRLNDDRSFSPVLAERWRFEDEGRTAVFTLRDNVKWHDGTPLTADDVIWSALEYWKPFSPETLFEYLRVVKAQGQDVRFRFDIPVPQSSFLTLLGLGVNYVLPKHLYADTDLLLNPVNNAPIGTGPWIYSEWVRGSHAVFLRNPNYWQAGKPKADKLIIRWFREPASRIAALETGQLDIAVSSPAALNDLKRLQGNTALKVNIEFDAGGGGSLYFNTRRKPFDDVRVRQALLYAIDREFIARTVYNGFGKPAISPIYQTNTVFFTADVPLYPFDTARAERLLDEAGLKRQPDGTRLSVNLLASGWYEENGKVGAYLKQALEDIGIRVVLRVPDRANSLKALYTDYDFDLAYSQGGGTAGEPMPSLGMVYGTSGIQKGLNFRNASRFSDPQTDELIRRITVEADDTRRITLVHDFARRLSEQVPVVPLVEVSPHYIHRNSVNVGETGISLTTDSWGDISKT